MLTLEQARQLKGNDVIGSGGDPYDTSLVAAAPRVCEDEDRSPEQEDRLDMHNGLSGSDAGTGDDVDRDGDGRTGHLRGGA